MSIFAAASGMIPEYENFTHRCIAIEDKQCQQGLNAPTSASIRESLLGFEKPLIANDSEGCPGSDFEGQPPSFVPNNELEHSPATLKSAEGEVHESQASWSFDSAGEEKDNTKDKTRHGSGALRQRATTRKKDESRRSAIHTTRRSAISGSKVSKPPAKSKSDKKKQAKPKVKAEDQVKVGEEFDIERIVGKGWGPDTHPGEWCYLTLWEGGGQSYEPCSAMRNENGRTDGNPRLVAAFEADMISERAGGPRRATQVPS